MFERFTERARKVMVLAQDEARHFNHNYIGTEHILLGLVSEGRGVAAQSLSSLGVTLGAVRDQVESIIGYGEDSGRQIPFTPRSKKVMELGLRESMQLGHNYIGTEHILLGLVREGEGVAARVFSNLGIAPGRVRREVLRRLGEETEPEPVGETEAEAAGNRMAFRGRVDSLQVGGRVGGRAMTLLVGLDYEYEVRDTDEPSEALNHGDLLGGVVEVFEGSDLGSVEAGILEAGRLVLDGFPAVHEVVIGATRELEGRAATGITVNRTFRR
ncbi:MAG TPA: Clp protease N-terminal domain-containing protein [Rubrobacter sp.]|nr:Clp protease N-terminal domain-containing protein [Rubrobacter sp.]